MGFSLIVKATYDFAARNERELTIKKDDLIQVLAKDDEGWWRGKLGENIGLFPSNYTTTHETKSLNRLKLSSKVSSRVLRLQAECGFTPRQEKEKLQRKYRMERKPSIVEAQQNLVTMRGFPGNPSTPTTSSPLSASQRFARSILT